MNLTDPCHLGKVSEGTATYYETHYWLPRLEKLAPIHHEKIGKVLCKYLTCLSMKQRQAPSCAKVVPEAVPKFHSFFFLFVLCKPMCAMGRVASSITTSKPARQGVLFPRSFHMASEGTEEEKRRWKDAAILFPITTEVSGTGLQQLLLSQQAKY